VISKSPCHIYQLPKPDLIRSSRPRPDAFNHFLSLVYTLSPKARKFCTFQSHTILQIPLNRLNQASTGPRSVIPALVAQSIPLSVQPETDLEMTDADADATNQPHLRKDSHMHIKEEDSHAGSLGQTKEEDWPVGSSQQVKKEDTQTDNLGQIDPWPSSIYESPHITSERLTQLSPNTPSSVTEPPFSPITPRSSFPYAVSSTAPSEERKRWQQTVLNNDEPTIVMPAIMPYDPEFPAIQAQNQLPRIPDLDRPPAPRLSPLSTTPPQPSFHDLFHPDPSSSPAARRPDA